MSYMKRQYERSRRTKAGRPKAPKKDRSIQYQYTETPGVDEFLAKIPALMKTGVLHGVTVEQAKVVSKELEARAPDSDETGTKDFWSAKVKAQRAHGIGIRDSAAYKKHREKKHLDTVASSAGFERPFGNHMILIEEGSETPLWDTGAVNVIPPRPFIRPAVDAAVPRLFGVGRDYIKKRWERI